jgi:hypothetical protein
MDNGNAERWKEIAGMVLKEQDPTRLTELIRELNLALDLREAIIDPPYKARE